MGLLINLCKWNQIPGAAGLVLAILLSASTRAQNNEINSRPTLDPIANDTTIFSADIRYIELEGITPGEEADQQVSIAVSTSDTQLIRTIAADLVDNGKAFINYQLNEGVAGTATIKVVVTDNGTTPISFTRIFHITVEPLNRELSAKIEEQANTLLKAIPNPASASTRLFFSSAQDEEHAVVDLYTLSGVKIKQLFTGSILVNRPHAVDVNVKDLPSGMYIVRLTGQSQKSTLKLAVAK